MQARMFACVSCVGYVYLHRMASLKLFSCRYFLRRWKFPVGKCTHYGQSDRLLQRGIPAPERLLTGRYPLQEWLLFVYVRTAYEQRCDQGSTNGATKCSTGADGDHSVQKEQ